MSRGNNEFFNIIKPIINNCEFDKLKDIRHHGITRYDHCMRVAYYSYIVTKFLRLNYKDTTEAALLHDFFTDEVVEENFIKRLTNHPNIAYSNASKYFKLNKMQEDIIKTHMFPITVIPPKYLESWIVDIVDDIAAVYEKVFSVRKELSAATTFLFLLLINYMR